MDINKEVVGNIAKLRKQNHLTQEQMAEKIGMSKNGYAKLERGQSKVNLEHLAQIADILNMEISELLKENREFTVFINGKTNKNFRFNHAQSQSVENLELIIQHKDEIIALKDNEIALLKRLLEQGGT